MMTLILVTISIAASCIAAVGLIVSVQTNVDADRPMAGLTLDGGDVSSMIVSDRE